MPKQTSEPSRKLVLSAERDPHLVSSSTEIVEDPDAVRVAGAEVFSEQDRDDRLWEPGAPPLAAAPSANCSPLDSSIPGALKLMIEAIRGNQAAPAEIERKL